MERKAPILRRSTAIRSFFINIFLLEHKKPVNLPIDRLVVAGAGFEPTTFGL